MLLLSIECLPSTVVFGTVQDSLGTIISFPSVPLWHCEIQVLNPVYTKVPFIFKYSVDVCVSSLKGSLMISFLEYILRPQKETAKSWKVTQQQHSYFLQDVIKFVPHSTCWLESWRGRIKPIINSSNIYSVPSISHKLFQPLRTRH